MFQQGVVLIMLTCNHTSAQGVIRHEKQMFTASVRNTKKLSVLARATVMATNIKVFLQVALLCYMVTNSIGSTIDLQKSLATLQKEVENLKQQSQEEINSLVTELNELRQQSKQEIKLLHQRLEQIEAKG